MELAYAAHDPSMSPLAQARLHRQLTPEHAAQLAGITADQVEWLEEGRVYRFRSTDDALLAMLLYATALGIDHREALELAGLPVPPKPFERNPHARVIGAAAIAALLAGLVFGVVIPSLAPNKVVRTITTSVDPSLPAPWQIHVEVLNGAGDIDWTRQVASRLQALSYGISKVKRADRFDYTETAVYFPPGGTKIAERLARQLDAPTRPLPGGTDPRTLVVIVGPKTAAG
jgi:transcriptional regulator with XRE-family HTH domain